MRNRERSKQIAATYLAGAAQVDGAPGAPMSGGRSPRQKGNRVERFIVNLLQDFGLAAEKIPLSGSAGGSFKGDVSIPLLNIDRVVEVKSRKRGWQELYRWLQDRDVLIVRADRSEPLVIIRMKLAAEIAAIAERNKDK